MLLLNEAKDKQSRDFVETWKGKFPDFVAAKGNQKFITKSDEITALSTIHPNRRCSGLLFGTVFLRFKPKTKRFLRLNHTYLPHWICQATYGSVLLHICISL